jgi:uncharacterized membrane protein required for colicin V production
LNGLDFAILFTFLAIIGLGFFGGMARVAAAIVAIYIASIVAGAFYQELAQVFRDHVSNINRNTSELFVFMVLFLISGSIAWWLVSAAFKGIKVSRQTPIAGNLGGTTLGVVVSAMAVVLAVLLISILLQVLNQTVGSGSAGTLGNSISNQIQSSALVPVFLDVQPYVTQAIEPWFRNGVPSILSTV